MVSLQTSMMRRRVGCWPIPMNQAMSLWFMMDISRVHGGYEPTCGGKSFLPSIYIYILWYAADIFPRNLVWDRISSWYVVVWYCMFILGSRVWRIVIIRMGFRVMSIANSIANHWQHVSQHLAGYERTYRSAVVRVWLTWQHALGAHMFWMSNKQRDINQGSLHRGNNDIHVYYQFLRLNPI